MNFFGKKDNSVEDEWETYEEEDVSSAGSWVRDLWLYVWEVVKVIIIALIIIVPVRYYIFQPFYVQGASMEPNFLNNEYLIIDEISYRFSEPERGDVVVFRYPRDKKQFFIKRIIGLPGEDIAIRDNQVIIYNQKYPNGFVLDESSYLSPNTQTAGNLRVSMGKDEYFVMGDNRASSLDSRSFGPIKRKDIIGRVFVRVLPVDRFTLFTDGKN